MVKKNKTHTHEGTLFIEPICVYVSLYLVCGLVLLIVDRLSSDVVHVHIEVLPGTCSRHEVSVSDNGSVVDAEVIFCSECCDEHSGTFNLIGGRFCQFKVAAEVDADASAVVSVCMGTFETDRASFFDASVFADDVVISDVRPSHRAMRLVEFFG